MSKEFIPYEQALELKELGFDEKCLTSYNSKKELVGVFDTALQDKFVEVEDCFVFNSKIHTTFVAAPLYQQAFRWFREKYNLFSSVSVDQTMEPKFCYALSKYADPYDWAILVFNSELYYTYEEAELACLKELIEIVKNQ